MSCEASTMITAITKHVVKGGQRAHFNIEIIKVYGALGAKLRQLLWVTSIREKRLAGRRLWDRGIADPAFIYIRHHPRNVTTTWAADWPSLQAFSIIDRCHCPPQLDATLPLDNNTKTASIASSPKAPLHQLLWARRNLYLIFSNPMINSNSRGH